MAKSMDELEVLRSAEQFSNEIWQVVLRWGTFSREVVGKQLARSADSIGANIAESFGRYHFGEKINFLYYARGSLFETKYWLNQCQNRGLVDGNQHTAFALQLETIGKQLNGLVRTLKHAKQSAKKIIKETPEPYLTQQDELDAFDLIDETALIWLTTVQSPIANHQLPIQQEDQYGINR
jgi:four helix bundle protein